MKIRSAKVELMHVDGWTARRTWWS